MQIPILHSQQYESDIRKLTKIVSLKKKADRRTDNTRSTIRCIMGVFFFYYNAKLYF